jgi:hypothetical protein
MDTNNQANNQANNSSAGNAAPPNPGPAAPRDWWSEREHWREERRKWRHEHREHRRHMWPFHGLFCGLTLVLFGVLFLLNQTGAVVGDAWWQWLLIGLGSISIIDGLARWFSPGHRWGIFGKFLGGVVMILVGSLFMAGFGQWWPVIIIVAGVAVMSRVFWYRAAVSSR